MDSKQSLAKIGVFVLLGINVGAYYYFWPRHDDGTKTVAKAAVQEKGEPQLLPPKLPAPVSAEPKRPSAETVSEAVPLAIPIPPPLPERKHPESRVGGGPTDAALKLMEFIEKDKLPELPRLPAAESAKREEPAKINQAGFIPMLPDPGVAVASPLTPKIPPGLWMVQTDKVGNRTQLIARLRDAASERVVVEFRILCDRAETNPQSGAVQALGNVAFSGAGWKGACQAVTLPVHEPRLVFEREVQVMQDILGTSQDGVLRGERIVWELPGPAAAGVSGVTLPLSR